MTTTTIERAKRPTDEFLSRVGIKALPPHIDVVLYDPPSFSDSARQTLPQFLIRSFDAGGRLVAEDSVNAHQHSGNAPDDIFDNLKRKLTQLGAKPA